METPTRDQLIFSFIPMVAKIVGAFIARNPHFREVEDDLGSVGTMKVIEAVDRFEGKSKDSKHFANYVRISIVTGLTDFIRNNSVIRAPKDQWVTCLRLGGIGDPPEAFRINGPRPTRDLAESCKDTTDEIILKMTLAGANRKQIAEHLCLTQKEVRARAGGILRRARSG